MKRVLMIAFHFPPLAGGSGIQRTLRFVQHLPADDWLPVVLAPHPRAYAQTGDDLLAEIPAEVPVHRAFALDASRHFAVRGHYLACTARPDRWSTWKFAAVRDGLRLIEQYRPALIWSTYPIATAHAIGAELQRRSGLPWVADFRDPMAQEGYPADPRTRRSFVRIEAEAFRRASRCVFTTPGAAALYATRYPDHADKVAVIENGYDEESFLPVPERSPLKPGCLTLLHSGIVYPAERDPRPLFAALSLLRERGDLRPGEVCLRFRAPVHDRLLQELTAMHDLSDFVEILPPIPYRDALAEMQRADALLLMQAATCNAQIPAKYYEYLRAGRPIVALTDAAGDTAGSLLAAGIDTVGPIAGADGIADFLLNCLARLRSGTAPLPQAAAVQAAERRQRARQLADLFGQVAA